MATSDDQRRRRAREALAGPEFAPLWAAARRRLEGNGRSLAGTPVRVGDLDADQRRAIAGLLAVSAAGDRPLRVRLADLDAALRTGAASIDLIGLLEAIGGPVRDRRGESAAARRARDDAWSAVEAHPALVDHPALADWVATVRRSGAATRAAGSPVAGAELTGTALNVVVALPATNVALSVLAAEHTGDAHSLDRGTPLGTLVAGALASLDTEETEDDRRGGPTAAAYWWRRRWARAGVVCDDLSVSVLALNLPVTGDDMIATAIDDHRIGGEPLRLTLRQLAIGGFEVPARTTVNVCENPAVVAQAAGLLERRSAPLVCVEGQPNTAALTLLDTLAAGGARLRYHGDFDWDGLRIGGSLIARYGMEPWRFSAEDYRAAAPRGRLALGDPPADLATPWSPGLVAALDTERVAIHEEQVLGPIIEDLDADV